MNPNLESRKSKILIVEDEAIIAKNLEDTLTALDYEVVGIVDTGVKAIMSYFGTSPDLILMDIHLKGSMDGITAAQTIRTQKEVPIVFLTANQENATFKRAKLEGAYGYLLKPFQERELQIVIDIGLKQFEFRKTESELIDKLMETEKITTAAVVTKDILNLKLTIDRLFGEMTYLEEQIKPKLSPEDQLKFSTSLESMKSAHHSAESTLEGYEKNYQQFNFEKSQAVSIPESCKNALKLVRYTPLGQSIRIKEISGPAEAKAYVGPTAFLELLAILIRKGCLVAKSSSDPWLEINWKEFNSTHWMLTILFSSQTFSGKLTNQAQNSLKELNHPAERPFLGSSRSDWILGKYSGELELSWNDNTSSFILKVPK